MKNVTVKTLKQGIKIFVSHPEYGIEEYLVTSKPYVEKGIGLFCKAIQIFDNRNYETSFSLVDAGITPGLGYNHRKTFFKCKQAEAWQRKMVNDPGFIAQHEQHERFNKDTEEMESMFNDYWDY